MTSMTIISTSYDGFGLVTAGANQTKFQNAENTLINHLLRYGSLLATGKIAYSHIILIATSQPDCYGKVYYIR